jgi:glutamate-ammonia-ligase adenylyltransferase
MKDVFDSTELEKLTRQFDPAIIKDFLDRMDPDYFLQFPTRTVAEHVALANALTSDHPCALLVQPATDAGRYRLTVVAYDYFAEFATICGLLSAYGFDIREALVFTYHDDPVPPSKPLRHMQALKWPIRRPRQRPGLFKRKVVDVFQVYLLPGTTFDAAIEQELSQDLSCMICLLASRKLQEVRNYVNRKLVETLGRRKTAASALVHPVEIFFNNARSTRDTVVDINGTDSPAFLYAFTNALAMRGLYFSKAVIDGDGLRVRNRFFVRDQHDKKIVSAQEQQELTVAAALIKEFTHSLTWAPDPGKALNHFSHFLDQLLEHRLSKKQIGWLTRKDSLANLARLFGTSDFLWEDFLRRQHVNLLPIVETFHQSQTRSSKTALAKTLKTTLGRDRNPETRKTILNRFKDQELFYIDMHHILNETSLPLFSESLTTLAEVIVVQALVEAQAVVNRKHPPPSTLNKSPLPFSICGLGKLGGRELGYASDIELIFVYGTNATGRPNPDIGEYYERLVQEFLHWIEAKQEGIFQIDIRLRPHGEKGLLANFFDDVKRYYRTGGPAAPFERQALIKLRHVAGHAALGRRIERYRDEFVYSRTSWPLDTALHLRRRQIRELVPRGAIHIKYSPGGLIDVEYAAQYLQLQHGYRFASLHTPNTLDALEALEATRVLSRHDATILMEDYLFLRKVIDGLRIVRGNAKDLVLPESGSDDMTYLARRLGYIADVWKEGAQTFENELQQRMNRAHAIFVKLFDQTPSGKRKRRLSD